MQFTLKRARMRERTRKRKDERGREDKRQKAEKRIGKGCKEALTGVST